MTFSIDQVMQFGWQPVLTEEELDEERVIALRVPPIVDFVIYGETRAEVLADWQSALRSHLGGYLAVGKAIPGPARLTTTSDEAVVTSAAQAWSRVVVTESQVTDMVSSTADAERAA